MDAGIDDRKTVLGTEEACLGVKEGADIIR